MSKLLVTRWKDRILTVLFEGQKAVSLMAEPDDSNASILNNVYIGKVQKVVENIRGAFIEIAPGKTGFYEMGNSCPKVLNRPGAKKLACGDQLIVQVSRDPVKTKAPVLTDSISLAGKYCVLTAHHPGIGFSSKLPDDARKKKLRSMLAKLLEHAPEPDMGLIVRTNSQNALEEQIAEELEALFDRYRQILDNASYRLCYSLLYRAPAGYVTQLRDLDRTTLTAVVTDQQDCFLLLKEYLEQYQRDDLGKLSFYQDHLVSLACLYSLERITGEALASRVWLKSGGYLVIEPTEAMTVIDVNTGKYSGRKTRQETILKINREAAAQIGRQLRLRNLSGIIIVDFIDMAGAKDRQLLLKELSAIVEKDPVKTVVVDMTRLNLVELTRKKVRRPFYEQIRGEAP